MASTDSNEYQEKTQKSMDQLTMSLLLNKTQYHKYLAKTDAQKHAEYCEFLEGCSLRREQIVDTTVNLLDNNNKNKEINKYSQEVQNAFNEYAKTVIRYLEIQESMNSRYKDKDEDEDMMFPPSMN